YPHAQHSSLHTILPPPRSALFPCTTLFRSEPVKTVNRFGTEPTQCSSTRSVAVVFQAMPAWIWHSLGIYQPSSTRASLEKLQQRDRKSTRLNSSHVSISYAVFCLKKTN